MSKQVKIFGVLFFGVVMALAMGLAATRPASAAPTGSVLAQACELPPSVDGSADPTTVMPGQTITMTVFNFRGGEEVSFWFTDPDGDVFGTANPLCCAPPSGRLIFPNLRIPEEFREFPGRWAFTVQGRDSGHTSVVYFCVSNTAQATATPVPPTATPVPATATSVPATATTEVTVQPTAPVATAEATATTAATAQPTTEATVQPTSPPAATVEATVPPAPEVTVMPTPGVIGMPRTGEPFPIGALALIMLSVTLLAAGLATLQRRPSSR